jgi:hypothetical protein
MEVEVMEQRLMAQSLRAKRENLRAAHVLSVIVAVMAAAASIVGLVFQAVYRGKGWSAMAFGNDLITLVVAVPVLVVALIFSIHGSVRGHMVWLGSLYYMFYNYAFYVFGLPVTGLYLPLIGIFMLSAFALALGMVNLDVEAISRRFGSRTPAKPIAVYMLIWAAMVGGLWISQWLKFVFTGNVPDVNGDQNAYRVIAAVDLCFIASLLIPAACLLWRRRPRGYVLGVMFNVQGAEYTAVMGTVCVFGWMAALGSRLISTWFISCIISCIASLLCLCGLLLNVERSRVTN